MTERTNLIWRVVILASARRHVDRRS